MMAGETLPECEVCNDKLLNTDVYRTYFWHLFQHKYDDVIGKTDLNGRTSMLPVSWDYRFSNLCNFKCRTCGDMLSSAWETEQRQHQMIDWSNTKNAWMQPDIRREITQFQDTQIEEEFSRAVEEHRVEEIYWVGGDWQICASLDGTGPVGEYIRTGLSYPIFLNNFRQGLEIATNTRQMRLDFTLTLPGMFEVDNMNALANELGVQLLAKVIFSFSPDIIMSPLALPRHLLDPWIDELAGRSAGAMRDVLLQLKTRPTFEEQWPDTYRAGLAKGRARVLQLESIRTQKITMAEILSARPEIKEWWDQIA